MEEFFVGKKFIVTGANAGKNRLQKKIFLLIHNAIGGL